MLLILNIYLYPKSHIQIRYWKCIINPFHVVLCVILQLEENWQIASSFDLPGMRRNQCKLALCSDRLKAARDNDYFVDRTLFSSLLSCRFPPYCLSLSHFHSISRSLLLSLSFSLSLNHYYMYILHITAICCPQNCKWILMRRIHRKKIDSKLYMWHFNYMWFGCNFLDDDGIAANEMKEKIQIKIPIFAALCIMGAIQLSNANAWVSFFE